MKADLDLKMAAAGLRGALLDGGEDGFTLAAKNDAMAMRTSTGRGRGHADDDTFAPVRATVTRLWLGLRLAPAAGSGALGLSFEVLRREPANDDGSPAGAARHESVVTLNAQF